MARRKGKKRVLYAGGLILAILLLVWVSAPLWFPWVLKPLARKEGGTYTSYERKGYSRFVLGGLIFTNRTVELHAERVEALVPTTWLSRAIMGQTKDPFLLAQNWQLKLIPSGDKTTKPGSPIDAMR